MQMTAREGILTVGLYLESGQSLAVRQMFAEMPKEQSLHRTDLSLYPEQEYFQSYLIDSLETYQDPRFDQQIDLILLSLGLAPGESQIDVERQSVSGQILVLNVSRAWLLPTVHLIGHKPNQLIVDSIAETGRVFGSITKPKKPSDDDGLDWYQKLLNTTCRREQVTELRSWGRLPFKF